MLSSPCPYPHDLILTFYVFTISTLLFVPRSEMEGCLGYRESVDLVVTWLWAKRVAGKFQSFS